MVLSAAVSEAERPGVWPSFALYLRTLAAAMPRRLAVALLITLLGALSEGLGLLVLVPLLGFLAASFRHMPRPVRNSLCVALAVNLPLLLLFCYRDELRNLSLVFVPALIALASAWASSRRSAHGSGTAT